MKLLLIAAVACFALGSTANDASAQGGGRKGSLQNISSGACPPGTCASNGGRIAKNPNLCNASNCGGGAAQKTRRR